MKTLFRLSPFTRAVSEGSALSRIVIIARFIRGYLQTLVILVQLHIGTLGNSQLNNTCMRDALNGVVMRSFTDSEPGASI